MFRHVICYSEVVSVHTYNLSGISILVSSPHCKTGCCSLAESDIYTYYLLGSTVDLHVQWICIVEIYLETISLFNKTLEVARQTLKLM